MAYAFNDYRVVCRGMLQDGAETWFNTWTLRDGPGNQDPADLAPFFNVLYNDIFAEEVSSHTSFVGATATNLSTREITELDIENIVGDDLADPMPGQLAVRISLSGPGGVRGGPFLAGWSKNAGNEFGLFSHAAAIATAVETFATTLGGADWTMRIDTPTVENTVAVTAGRVGQRFDVIRRRENDIAEAYATINLP